MAASDARSLQPMTGSMYSKTGFTREASHTTLVFSSPISLSLLCWCRANISVKLLQHFNPVFYFYKIKTKQ